LRSIEVEGQLDGNSIHGDLGACPKENYNVLEAPR